MNEKYELTEEFKKNTFWVAMRDKRRLKKWNLTSKMQSITVGAAG